MQSVEAASTVGKDTRGYYPGKKIDGRKRNLMVDTRSLPRMVMVSPADLHDTQAAKKSCSACQRTPPGSYCHPAEVHRSRATAAVRRRAAVV